MTEPPRDEPFDSHPHGDPHGDAYSGAYGDPMDPGPLGGSRPGPQPGPVPNYPAQQGYPPQAGYGTPETVPAGSAPIMRLLRRPEPRLGVAIAALGALLTLFGVFTLANSTGGSLGGDGDPGKGHQILGLILSLAVVVVGYGLVAARPSGPLSAAGVAAGSLAVASSIGFAFALGDASPSATAKGGLPIAIVVWLVSYWLPSRLRGHVFYLGAALGALWLWIVVLVNANAFALLFFLPVARAFSSFDPSGDGVLSGPSYDNSDFTTLAVLSILVGLVYYAAGFVVTRSGRAGAGVAFAVAGVPALVFGLVFAAINAGQTLEGVLVLAASLVVAVLGARSGRRFTTWFWTLGIGVGIVVLLQKAVGDDDTAAGISLIVIGVALAALSPLLQGILREPDETTPTPLQRAA